MDQNTLLILLTIFVALAAIAMLVQAIMLVGLLLVARQLKEKLFSVWPEIQAGIGVTRRTIEQVQRHVEKIGATSVAILDVTKQQLDKAGELLTDASTRAKVQMERAEMVLDDSMTRVQETVKTVQSGVLWPIREVHGIAAGIRTALSHLGRSRRSTVDRATSDEELFI